MSAESQAAARLQGTAGAANVKRIHFGGLQHHKVLVVRRNGTPVKVLMDILQTVQTVESGAQN